MFERLFPSHYVNNIYEIDYKALYKKGYRGIIFDIDNTLTRHGAKATKRNEKFFEYLKKIGYNTAFLSNNNEDRVKMFNKNIGSFYVCDANKPSIEGYIKAVRMMQTSIPHTFFVGDQIFTDIWGANRTGLMSILTKPIHPREEIQIVLKRILEKPIISAYKKSLIRNHICEEAFQ